MLLTSRRRVSSGIVTGKKGLILGVANEQSIAWAVAKRLHAEGAELAFTYQNEKTGQYVLPGLGPGARCDPGEQPLPGYPHDPGRQRDRRLRHLGGVHCRPCTSAAECDHGGGGRQRPLPGHPLSTGITGQTPYVDCGYNIVGIDLEGAE